MGIWYKGEMVEFEGKSGIGNKNLNIK